jgi:hypothetical protein
MLDMSSDVDDIADFLTCLAGLEKRNSQLFQILSARIDLSSIKPQLTKIADDNEKQAKILEGMSQRIGNSKIKTKECKIRLSLVSKNIEDIFERVKNKKEIPIKDLKDYLDMLESNGGASQYLLIQAETFLLMPNEINKSYGMDSQKFNDLLSEMVQDIEEHILLSEEIKIIIEHELNKDKKNHPVIKYQSPDAWLTPSHSQRNDM